MNDVIAQIDALITNEYGWAGYEFFNLMLALAAE